MKIRILAPIIFVGLAVGFSGAALFAPVTSRSDRIIELLELICLPRFEGKDTHRVANRLLMPLPTAYDVSPASNFYLERRWYDEVSRSHVILNGRTCKIETYKANNLSRKEAKKLGYRLDNFRNQYFPNLEIDPVAHNWVEPISRGWFWGARESPERWGLYLMPFLDGRDDDASFLGLTMPRDPNK